MHCQQIISLLAIILLSGCGLRFGPGYARTDPQYFSEAPYIISRPDGYRLRWRYGSYGFFFQPSSKVVNGELLFSLQGTSSSGVYQGRYGEILIDDPKKIQALETGGAFWIERNGPKTKLEVRSE